jgi:alkylation response protein AidB-like acyl-CoA dehydrogenase
VHFAFTEEQRAIAASVDEVLASECPPDVIRAAEHERPLALLATLGEVGLLGLALSEAVDGLGLGAVDWVLPLVRAGHHAVPVPLTDALAVGPSLEAAGLPDLARALAAGEARISLAPKVSGLAQDADLADLVVAPTADGLAVLDASGAVRQSSVDRARWVFSGLQQTDLLPVDPTPIVQRATLATAAQLVGGARRMVEQATAYAKARRQFGKPIGAQQAVQHRLADALLAVSFAEPPLYAAAWALDTAAPTADRDVATAKALASDAARVCRNAALQVHGAIGYTLECDLQLWLTRSIALERLWGSAGHHHAKVADHLGL